MPNYRRVGRSRKKIVSDTSQPVQGELRQYYDKLDTTKKKLQHSGIDFEVFASWRRRRLSWATGVELVAPLEVRSELELKSVANLARSLL